MSLCLSRQYCSKCLEHVTTAHILVLNTCQSPPEMGAHRGAAGHGSGTMQDPSSVPALCRRVRKTYCVSDRTSELTSRMILRSRDVHWAGTSSLPCPLSVAFPGPRPLNPGPWPGITSLPPLRRVGPMRPDRPGRSDFSTSHAYLGT